MIRSYFRFLIAGFLCALFSIAGYAASRDTFTESVVIFNTICAKCHEAQCSGRMSFDGALETSRAHIIRHYAGASEKHWLQKELFAILNHMKEKCAFYPMDVPIPPSRHWQGDVLDGMVTLMERNYFIPLGLLTPGNYLLALQLERNTKVTIHLVSERFEMVTDDCFIPRDSQLKVPVTIIEAGNYFFRMYPQESVRITRLQLMNASQ